MMILDDEKSKVRPSWHNRHQGSLKIFTDDDGNLKNLLKP